MGSKVNFLNFDIFLCLKVVSILANRAEADEMQYYAAFHLGLHCLLKNPFSDSISILEAILFNGTVCAVLVEGIKSTF